MPLKRRNGWRVAAAGFLALFGPIVYAFGPEGAGVPRAYIPVGMMLPAIFTQLGPVILVWYGAQYLVYLALAFVALKLVQRAFVERRARAVPASREGRFR